ncbi:hypothetical protein [Curtobacterium flaccumfaciens]|uniref:hypothetical protein n=1 Tax=Curtobacterium flaccumfaciens TaxID=2035 RepID=UPI00387A65FB
MKQFCAIAISVLLIWAFCAHGGATYLNSLLVQKTTTLVEHSSPIKHIESGLDNPFQQF